MAKAKEKSVNPATAALKAAQKRSIKKNKSAVAQQRAERLSKRNPERLQRQIDALTEEREAAGGVLKPRDQQMLDDLQRDVKRIRKAKETLGVEETSRRERHEGRGGGVLGKRGRDGNRRERENSATDSDARDVPMPLDVENMPPVPRRQRQPRGQTQEKPAPAQTVYSSAPQIRDLRKEAVSRFVPAAVASKIAAAKGEGGKLLEPEEADLLEKQGYTATEKAADEAEKEVQHKLMAREAVEGPARSLEEEERRFEEEVRGVEGYSNAAEKAVDEADKETQYRLMAREVEEGPAKSLEEEERRFEQEARRVEIEEVSDEDL